MNFRTIFLILICWYSSAILLAQPEVKSVRKGNKAYDEKKYSDAEAEYKKALDVKNNMPEAIFNLGDALYRQEGRLDEAAGLFTLSSKTNTDSLIRAKSYHNLGNIYLLQEKYAEAISSFKQSLKINPRSEDTRYNLAYALAKKKQQEQSQKDNKEDKQNQQKNEDKKDKNQQDSKDNNQKEQKQQQENSQPDKDSKGQKIKPQLSKEDAQKLLEALQREEQKAQQKMMQQQMPAREGKILKDW